MIKKKYIISTLILSLLCMNKTYAVCTEQARKEFEQIEDQYKITSEFDKETKTYTVRIESPNTKKYKCSFNLDINHTYKKINDKTEEISGVKSDAPFYVYIVGNTKECNELMTSKEVKLKRYNEYYEDPLCQGIEEFVLCQEFYDRELDRETFEKRIASYKNKLQAQKNEENSEKKENNFIEDMKKYVEENIIQVVIIVIFIILVIISTIIGYKTVKKSRRLE